MLRRIYSTYRQRACCRTAVTVSRTPGAHVGGADSRWQHGYCHPRTVGQAGRSVWAIVCCRYLKANPDKVNFSSSGIGSTIHMSGELLKIATGTRMTHVPYKGMTAAYTDLLSGQVQASFPTVVSSIGHINSGRLRPLAMTTTKRVAALPHVPTFAEAGVEGMVVVNWYALIAPLKTPQSIIDRLAAETNKAMRSPEMRKSLQAEGSEAVTGSPAELAAHIKTEHEQWSRVVKTAGILVN